MTNVSKRLLLPIAAAMLAFAFIGPGVGAQSKRDIDRAKKLAQQGDQAYQKGNYKEAIEKYADSLKLVPTQPVVRFNKGYAHNFLTQYRPALVEFNLAMAQGYEPVKVYQVRYTVHYQLGDLEAALKDALEGARLDKAGTFSNTVIFNMIVGDGYRNRKEYANAIEYYKKVAALEPQSKNIYYLIALSFKEMGNVREAGMAALEALNRGTRFVLECNLFVGDMYIAERRRMDAVGYYEKALAESPDSNALYNTIADIYRIENRFDRAIAVLVRGSGRFPNDAIILTNLSWNYSLANMHNEAVEAASRAIAAAPNESAAYTNRCRAYNDLQKYDFAIASCTDALKLSPDDGETYLYMGRAYQMLKQTARANENFRKAVDGLTKYVKENPDYSDAHYLLGNAYYNLEKFPEAIENYKKCLALAPRFARARFTLGFAYLERGNKSAAMEQYKALLEIDPAMAATLKAEIDR